MTARIAPRLGGNLFSVWSESHQRDLLLSPATPEELRARPTRFGTPILMPPGRLRQGAFTYRGHTYQFDRNRGEHHAHGLVLTLPWDVEETEAGTNGARVVMGVQSTRFADLLRQFPHEFHLRVEYRLSGGVVTGSARIENQGARPMPFGLGFHTYLNATGACTVRLGARQRWELAGGFLTGERVPAADSYDLRQGRLLHPQPLNDVFSALEQDADGWSGVHLHCETTGLSVTCEADGHFPHWVLFSGHEGERGFLAAEPHTAVPGALNLDLPPDLTGLQTIPPGTSTHAGTWRLRPT